jgi:hypothetical protein
VELTPCPIDSLKYPENCTASEKFKFLERFPMENNVNNNWLDKIDKWIESKIDFLIKKIIMDPFCRLFPKVGYKFFSKDIVSRLVENDGNVGNPDIDIIFSKDSKVAITPLDSIAIYNEALRNFTREPFGQDVAARLYVATYILRKAEEIGKISHKNAEVNEFGTTYSMYSEEEWQKDIKNIRELYEDYKGSALKSNSEFLKEITTDVNNAKNKITGSFETDYEYGPNIDVLAFLNHKKNEITESANENSNDAFRVRLIPLLTKFDEVATPTDRDRMKALN